MSWGLESSGGAFTHMSGPWDELELLGGVPLLVLHVA